MTDSTASKNVISKVPVFRVIDENDAVRFAIAADKSDAANTASPELARARLMELGFIDEHGQPKKPYR